MNEFALPTVKLISVLLAAIGLFSGEIATIHNAAAQAPSTPPASDTMPASGQAATALKFFEFFKMPIGPRGLQPTEKLVGLNGQRVRILGYMAKQEQPAAGMFLLTPLPVSMGDEDEGLADDLPPSTVFVHFESDDRSVSYIPGLITLTGVLSVGAQSEADGRVSSVRLILDDALSQKFLGGSQERHASK